MGADKTLHLDISAAEDSWMAQVGHLRQWCSDTETAIVMVPRTTPQRVIGPSVSLLFNFDHLCKLDLTLISPGCLINQTVVSASAELLGLTSLTLSGGSLPSPETLDFGRLTRCVSEEGRE